MSADRAPKPVKMKNVGARQTIDSLKDGRDAPGKLRGNTFEKRSPRVSSARDAHERARVSRDKSMSHAASTTAIPSRR